MKKLRQAFYNMKEHIVDDSYRYYMQMVVFPMILGCVSLGMFTMNMITHKALLAAATLIFGIESLLIAIMVRIQKRTSGFAYVLYSVNVLALFTYFLITGGTAGFSPMWICILPMCGFMLFGLKKGTIVCSIMFLITVFLLDTPPGQCLVMYDFTSEFKMRFPVVYLSCFILGFIFEWIRGTTNISLMQMREQYRNGMVTDSLTNLHNRYWIESITDRLMSSLERGETLGIIIFDIDRFKSINDKYGHIFGDKVLRVLAAKVREITDENLCRWGGEEFIYFAIGLKEDAFSLLAEKIRVMAENMTIEGCKDKITVSVGAVFCDKRDADMTELIREADNALYKAKEQGRNCTVAVKYR